MRKFILIILLSIISLSLAQAQSDSKVKWMSFEEAVKLNETNPKPIFIDVYAVWCGPCKQMDRVTFNNDEVAKILNEKFHPVKFDAESKEPVKFGEYTYVFDTKNRVHQLAIALLQGQMAYPSVVYMSEENQLLNVVPGAYQPKEIKPMLMFFGDGHYKTSSWNDYMAKNK